MATISLQILWRFPVEPTEGGAPAKGKAPKATRCIGVGEDGIFHVVAVPGRYAIGDVVAERDVVCEVSFSLFEGLAHCEAVLAGNQQAMTRPGGMRIVAATAKILGGMLFEPEAGPCIAAHAGRAPI